MLNNYKYHCGQKWGVFYSLAMTIKLKTTETKDRTKNKQQYIDVNK